MRRVPKAIAAGTESMNRQQRYKVIRFRLGQCINCGADREDSKFKRICKACGDARKKSRRTKLGFKAWKPGSPGRPPLSALKAQSETKETL